MAKELKAHRLRREIQAAREKYIDPLVAELEKHQNRCKHKNAEIEYKSNTGNYDPSADCYWANLFCPTCLKHWTVDNSHEDYRKYG